MLWRKTCWFIVDRRRKHKANMVQENIFLVQESWFFLQDFSTEEILKCHYKNCFENNGKQRIMPKKSWMC